MAATEPGNTTVPGEALTRTGVQGASVGDARRDDALVKLADSFGELAREASESLREARKGTDIPYYTLKRWNEAIAVVLQLELDRQEVSFDVVVNGDGTYKVDRWWWDLYEGVFYEINSELTEPISLTRPASEYNRKEDEQKKLELARSGDYVKNDDILKSLDQLVEEGVMSPSSAGMIKNDLGLAGMNVDG